MKRFQLIAVLLIVSILFTGCNALKKAEKEEIEEKIIPVELGKVQLGNIYNEFIISGRVLSESDAMVIPEIPGKVKEIKVEAGDKVNKGDVLFTLENPEIDDQVKSLQKTLGDLESKKSQLEKEIGREEGQGIKLSQEPILLAMADGELEGLDLDLDHIPEDIPEEIPPMPSTPQMPIPKRDPSVIYELDGKISELNSALNKAKKAQEKLVVKSSQAGTVSLINIQENGLAMNTEPAMIISDLNNMHIELNGTENIITKVNDGDKVRVEIPSLNIENMEGNISSISIMPNIKTGLYTIKIGIPSNADLKPGMIGKVFFQLDKKENIIVVDSDFIIEKNGDHIVYLVEDNKAVERLVKIGMETGDKVEILSGLEVGEKIIIKGQNFVKDGHKVKVLGGDN